MIEFEWDPRKAKSNAQKHGVTFEEATLVFQDPHIVSEQDRVVDGEIRWQSLGLVHGVMLALVAHTSDIDKQGLTEVIRIISARKANPRERIRYAKARTKEASGH
ncbi:MAG TPA: BrnT family toxin [Acidobacteriaceae bacterium]|nr:BrnT family toxin [Acidobacteriaceae bacterium]